MMEVDDIDEGSVMVCPFYLRAKCYRGENCEFAHELTNILPENVMCEFFLRGVCKYGKNCWFSHGTPEPVIKPSENNNDTPTSPDKIKMRYSFRAIKPKENEFVPISDELSKMVSEMRQSYADIVKKSNKEATVASTDKLPMEMCIHFDLGKCPFGKICPCIHGNFCDMCGKYCLDPYNKNQREIHMKECEKELERDMEYSFAIQISKDKICGICLEVVYDKERAVLRRFGILDKCNHVFCLECIREWRRRGKTDEYEPESMIDQRVMRACPQCRVQCNFVIPSSYWIDSEEEKANLIAQYKKAMKLKDCKHYNKGSGKCPFGGLCFYRHATQDGVLVELPPPVRRKRRNHRGNIDILDEVLLWDFIADRENWGENDFENLSDFIIDRSYDLGEYYI